MLGIALFGINTAYATGIKPNEKVKQSFNREFTKIQKVDWDDANSDGIYKASFVFNNENLQAYFTEEGDFLGTIRFIVKSQLPILVSKELDQKYPNAVISAVSELSKPDGLSYFITIITEKGSKVLKATANGELTVHQRGKNKL